MIETTESSLVENELVSFPELFERQVEETPDASAVFFEDSTMTYRQLNASANQVARYLLDQCEVSREQCVGLCVDKSSLAIAAMLGILKAGAAFVPLDPEYPVERLSFMIADANIGQIICADEYQQLFRGESNCQIIRPSDLIDHSQDDTPNLGTPTDSHDLAYVMYTSGSTGKPKGVQIEHRALAAYCFADINVYQVEPADRTLQFSTLNFDIAIEEIFPPLLTGSSIVVRPRERAAERNELSAIINDFGVTAVHLATAYWHEWVDLMHVSGQRVPASLRLMVVTGEKVSAEHYRRWKALCNHDILWCNAYGPTEATVSATVFIPGAEWDADNMPIGKPLDRYTAHILDENMDEAGATGELYIGGPALARGYLNRDELTEKAFVNVELTSGSTRLYKTGDLARWLPNGDIEFGGRIDHQIKLGSYRIEPGEIEAAINQCASVCESLVTHDAIDGTKHLIAYVATGRSGIELGELASFVRERLPAYMVPTRYCLLESFPKTINGKIDRKALPDASMSLVARTSDCVAPRTKLEADLVEIYADILNVPQVGIHDDFFALGGSSLLVTRIITRIAGHLETEIPVRDFFANPTVASIAQQIERLTAHGGSDGTDSDRNDETSRRIRESLPSVHPIYFASGTNNLFGVLYDPVAGHSSHAVVMCPSIGHEYARAHRNLQQLGVVLARNGYHVLRFDYAATGNSSGSPMEVTTHDWLGDVSQAVRSVRHETGVAKVTVLGVRLGATLAANADLDNDVSLVFCDPVFHGAHFCEFLDSLHRRTLRDLSRFPVQRKPVVQEQAYGLDLPHCLRESIASLSVSSTRVGQSIEIIRSNGVEIPQVADGWRIHDSDDDIFWDRVEFTESAFSSPNTFSVIVDILKEARNQ